MVLCKLTRYLVYTVPCVSLPDLELSCRNAGYVEDTVEAIC